MRARRTRDPSGNSPARMRANRSRLSSAGRSRHGLGRPGSVGVPRRRADLLRRLVVDVGLAGPDEVDGPVVELREVARGVVEVLAPVEPQPADVALDGVDVLLLLLGRIGVVEAQVAAAAELVGDAEVDADRLDVTDVEVTVRLGREARDDAADASFAEVGGDDLADEVAALGRGRRLGGHAREPSTGRGRTPRRRSRPACPSHPERRPRVVDGDVRDERQADGPGKGPERDLLLYNLTVQALERIESGQLSKREIIRRLGTSPAQFYRLIDTTNYRKSVDQMLRLLQVLDCEVEVIVRPKSG